VNRPVREAADAGDDHVSRRVGVDPHRGADGFRDPVLPSQRSVLTGPGEKQFTRIPLGPKLLRERFRQG